MIENSTAPSESLTVLVFKDNRAPRTFRVPLRWLSHFGLALSALVLTSLLCLALGLRFLVLGTGGHRPGISTSSGANPARVAELEHQVEELRKALSDHEPVEPPSAAAPQGSASRATGTLASLDTPARLFSALPASVTIPDPAAGDANAPIRLDAPRAAWHGHALEVSFNIENIAKDSGKQEGRILILARGPSELLTYPRRAFAPAGHDTLLDVSRGEHFSVSRLRPVQATFGPLADPALLQELEILVIGDDGHLLAHQGLAVPSHENKGSPPSVGTESGAH